jgi:hypothetical protein
MTPQEIYDTVAKHLFAQGVRSRGKKPGSEDTGCLYRGPEGTKCAVGVLMSDEVYDPEMEGNALALLFDPDATPDGGFELPVWMKTHFHLLSALQDTHDYSWYWYGSDHMKARLLQVAKDYELSAAVLDDLKFEWEVKVKAE